MDNFNIYAKYYDLLYNQKDYSGEVSYVNQLIRNFADLSVSSILDLGCGTGKHADLLSNFGYSVDGVDISPNMIHIAMQSFPNNDRLKFVEGDITTYIAGKKFDVVISLFHVISYQNTNEKLLATFSNAADHLNDNGLFIFDFWYGPGVLTDPPEVREKSLSDEEIDVVRRAVPVMHYDRNVVDVNYEVSIEFNDSANTEKFFETHSMRYFFKPELDYYLGNCGFEIVSFYNWLTHDKPDMNTWNAVVVAKKK